MGFCSRFFEFGIPLAYLISLFLKVHWMSTRAVCNDTARHRGIERGTDNVSIYLGNYIWLISCLMIWNTRQASLVTGIWEQMSHLYGYLVHSCSYSHRPFIILCGCCPQNGGVLVTKEAAPLRGVIQKIVPLATSDTPENIPEPIPGRITPVLIGTLKTINYNIHSCIRLPDQGPVHKQSQAKIK